MQQSTIEASVIAVDARLDTDTLAFHGSSVDSPGAAKHSDSRGQTRTSCTSDCDVVVHGRSDGTHQEYPAARSEHVAAGLLSLSSVST